MAVPSIDNFSFFTECWYRHVSSAGSESDGWGIYACCQHVSSWENLAGISFMLLAEVCECVAHLILKHGAWNIFHQTVFWVRAWKHDVPGLFCCSVLDCWIGPPTGAAYIACEVDQWVFEVAGGIQSQHLKCLNHCYGRQLLLEWSWIYPRPSHLLTPWIMLW